MLDGPKTDLFDAKGKFENVEHRLGGLMTSNPGFQDPRLSGPKISNPAVQGLRT